MQNYQTQIYSKGFSTWYSLWSLIEDFCTTEWELNRDLREKKKKKVLKIIVPNSNVILSG